MKKITLLILLATFLASCTKTVEYKGEITEPMLVVNSIINPDSIIEVFVSESWFFLNESSSDTISDASVKLFSGETEIAELQYDLNGKYIANDIHPEENINYRIEVNADGYDATSAETSLPNSIPVAGFDTITRFFEDLYPDILEVDILINDPAEEDNYYRITGFLETWRWDEYSNQYYYWKEELWLSSDDPVITGVENENDILGGTYNEYKIFDDAYFSGETYGVTMKTYPGNLYKDHEKDYFKYTFNLMSLSEGYFKYLRSKTLHEENEENPFVEPVPVYSNVSNGIGFFGGFSCASISFEHEGYTNPWGE